MVRITLHYKSGEIEEITATEPLPERLSVPRFDPSEVEPGHAYPSGPTRVCAFARREGLTYDEV